MGIESSLSLLACVVTVRVHPAVPMFSVCVADYK